MRLIDADELIEEFKCIISDCSSHGIGEYISAYEYAIRRIEDMPTIEQKHGHWVKVNNKNLNNAWVCSECGHMVYSPKEELMNRFKGCYCGAKMDESEVEE